MEEYFSAVHKMEQTVLFPSLLQEVSLDSQDDMLDSGSGGKDLYEYYMLLKSIKLVVEGGLVPLDQQKPPVVTRGKEQEIKEEDLEGFFYYHVSSLYRILTQLTRRANAVTSKYNEIMGQINGNEKRLSF